MKDKLSRLELSVAGILTILAIALRAKLALSAGGLWRDEASTLGVATSPTVREVWMNLQSDSFPLLWMLIVREVAHLGGLMNDPIFRLLGFGVGIALVIVLWFYARTLRYRIPLVSIALLGLTPSVITWGSTLRAYGFGMALSILCTAFLWRVVQFGRWRDFLLACVAAVLSVQALYYNSVLLLAMCSGGLVVSMRRRDPRTSILIAAVGAAAAMSMIPYAWVVARVSQWTDVLRIPRYDFPLFWSKLYETLQPGGRWTLTLWAVIFVIALVATARGFRNKKEPGPTQTQRDVAAFCATTMLVAAAGVFVFLRVLSYETQAWYYLSLLAICAICIDGISGSLIHTDRARQARLAAVIAFALLEIRPAFRTSAQRMTNIDIVADTLRSVTTPGDFVVVNPWYVGLSFNRYYRARVPWETIPAIGFLRYHRFDLLKKQMSSKDQEAPVRHAKEQIERALSTGHRVFVVGDFASAPLGREPLMLAPAPLPGNRWPEGMYQNQWSLMIGSFLIKHADTTQHVHTDSWHINPYENVRITMVSGWYP
ncbi:MAG: hypothetical protein ABR582_07390 [Gemmatimonadaceae bacterium]